MTDEPVKPERECDWAICTVCGARSNDGQDGIGRHITAKHPEAASLMRGHLLLLRLLRIAADDPDLEPASLEFAVVITDHWPFHKAEILALPREGLGHREIREGRSVSKYDVEIERFGTDYGAASRRSDEIGSGDPRWRADANDEVNDG